MHRIRHAIKETPIRGKRLFRHLARICPWKISWWLDFSFLLLDGLFVFDVYEVVSNLLSLRTRRLTDRERELLMTVYGDGLPYELIRVDEHARIGPPQGRFCYVSFHTINSWGPMGDALLVHEAMHVWQYHRVGAAYIPRALAAQRTEMGYNYGGLQKLREFPDLCYYNYEQQADIIADAFAVLNGYPTSWSPGASTYDADAFLPFLLAVRRDRDESVTGVEQ